MTGYRMYMDLQSCEKQANDLGFRFAYSKYGSREYDAIALYPMDDALPDYARDAELFCGTLIQVQSFLRGIQFNKQYYNMLRVVTDKKVAAAEQNVRNRRLVDTIKTAKIPKGIEK